MSMKLGTVDIAALLNSRANKEPRNAPWHHYPHAKWIPARDVLIVFAAPYQFIFRTEHWRARELYISSALMCFRNSDAVGTIDTDLPRRHDLSREQLRCTIYLENVRQVGTTITDALSINEAFSSFRLAC